MRFLQCNGGKLEEAEDFKCVYVVYCLFESEYLSALVHDLLSHNSLFVNQLYKDKSLAKHARDLIFLTTDLQTEKYHSTNHCQS